MTVLYICLKHYISLSKCEREWINRSETMCACVCAWLSYRSICFFLASMAWMMGCLFWWYLFLNASSSSSMNLSKSTMCSSSSFGDSVCNYEEPRDSSSQQARLKGALVIWETKFVMPNRHGEHAIFLSQGTPAYHNQKVGQHTLLTIYIHTYKKE